MGGRKSDAAGAAMEKAADQVASSSTRSLISGIFNRGSPSFLSSCRLQTGRSLRLEPLSMAAPRGSPLAPAARYLWLPAAGHCNPSYIPVASQSDFVDTGSQFGMDCNTLMTLNGLDGMVEWRVSTPEFCSQAVEGDAEREMADVVEAGRGGRIQILEEATATSRAGGNRGIDLLPLCTSVTAHSSRQREGIQVTKCRRTPAPSKPMEKGRIRIEACVITDGAGLKVRAYGAVMIAAQLDAIGKRRTRSVELRSRWQFLKSRCLELFSGKAGIAFKVVEELSPPRQCWKSVNMSLPAEKRGSLFQREDVQLENDYNVPFWLSSLLKRNSDLGALVPSSLDLVRRKQASFAGCCLGVLSVERQKPLLGWRVETVFLTLRGNKQQHSLVPPQFRVRATTTGGDGGLRLSSLEFLELSMDAHFSPPAVAHNQQAVGILGLGNSSANNQPAAVMIPDSCGGTEAPDQYPGSGLSRCVKYMDWRSGNVLKAGYNQTGAALCTSMDVHSESQQRETQKAHHQVDRRCGWVIRVAVASLVRRVNMKKRSRSPSCPLACIITLGSGDQVEGAATAIDVETSARLPSAKAGMLGLCLVGTILASSSLYLLQQSGLLFSKNKTRKAAFFLREQRAVGIVCATSLASTGLLGLITVAFRLGHKTEPSGSVENPKQRRARTRGAALQAISPYRNILLFLKAMSESIRRGDRPCSTSNKVVYSPH